jgi:two-component system nitrogen regulation sensor histidine kinase NtrY
MAAWREVARASPTRLEPLTRFNSRRSAEKEYASKVGQEDGKVFEECTNMIIDQVEGLKRLVNEFSSYARMPAPNLTVSDIRQIIEESLSLYREAEKNVKIVFRDSNEVPLLKVDREQMKRVMINLWTMRWML